MVAGHPVIYDSADNWDPPHAVIVLQQLRWVMFSRGTDE